MTTGRDHGRRGEARVGVAEIRHVGLAAGIELDPDLLAADPGLPAAAVVAARRHGVLSRALRGVALQISPPFVVTEDELEAIVAGVAAGIREALGTA